MRATTLWRSGSFPFGFAQGQDDKPREKASAFASPICIENDKPSGECGIAMLTDRVFSRRRRLVLAGWSAPEFV